MPTTNPVPSTDPSDLLFNAGKLDEVVNGTAASYTDRLGVSRRSLAGIDATADNVLNGIGYAVPVAYASGISLTLTSQTVEYAGEIYAPKSSALPFTTSSWGADSAKFRLMIASDASRVNYTPAGTGAVATTVQSKLREFVSVKDFGADPTGTTDSAAAIQAAVNSISTAGAGAGPGGVVYVPAGIYRINTQIDLPYGVSVKGAGGTASIIRCYDCDGLNFIKTVQDNDMQTVEDIGLQAMSGSNRVGILANAGTYPTSQNDGFYINRVKITGFNVGIYFTNAWQSVITNCLITQVNKAVWLADHAVLITVADNQFVREGGGAGTATNIGVEMSGLDLEANEVRNNFIFGFAVAVKMSDPWSAVVASNTILMIAPNANGAALIGIDFTTVKEHLNIFDNVIESAGQTLDTVIGIFGRPLSTPSGGATVIQNNRIFDDYGVMTTGIGIQINTSTDTGQNNVTIQNNNFFRFTTYDIAAYNPNAITIQNNRLESTGPTYSLFVSGTIFSPCVIQNNWCVKDIQIEPTERAQGKALVEYNYANATYRAVDQFKSSAAPTTGTWQKGDIVWNALVSNTGGWICTTAGTPGTWKPFGAVYEEGTFTVTVTPEVSGSITLDAANNTLSFTKIGRQIHIQGQLVISSVSAPVGSFSYLLYAPFPSADLPLGSGSSTGVVWFLDASAGYARSPRMLALPENSSNMIFSGFDASTIDAGDIFSISFTYFAA